MDRTLSAKTLEIVHPALVDQNTLELHQIVALNAQSTPNVQATKLVSMKSVGTLALAPAVFQHSAMLYTIHRRALALKDILEIHLQTVIPNLLLVSV